MKRSNIGMAVVGLVITVALVSRQPIPGGAEQMSGGDEWKAVEEALGRKGAVQPGDVYRVGLPRTDLKVKVHGVDVKAGFALGSYAAFRKTSEDAMVMGDLVLLDEEVPKVMSELLAQGLSVTALHNHLNEMSPHVMYMHYSGRGDVVKLAKSVRTALGASGTPFGESPASGSAAGPAIDQAQVEAALGRSGRINNGILQVGVPRAERITDGGMELLPAMGVATAINYGRRHGDQLPADGQRPSGHHRRLRVDRRRGQPRGTHVARARHRGDGPPQPRARRLASTVLYALLGERRRREARARTAGRPGSDQQRQVRRVK